MTEPTLIVEAAFAGGASTGDYLHLDDVARGLLDTAELGPDDGVWEDISDYVQSVRIRRGANRIESPVPRYEAGTCSINLDNSDRRFDPTYLSGPYVSAGVTQVTPMRAVRVLAEWDGVIYPLYRGFADEWKIDYDGPNYSVCVLTCTDATKVLSNVDRTAVAGVGAGEDSGARVDRILDSASWSASDRILATGDTTLQATTLDGAAWTELLLVQDTEYGELYLDEQGRVFFRNRQAAMEDLRSISAVANFGDSPDPNAETTVNLSQNPSLETATTGWTAGGSVPPTLSRSNTRAQFGTWSLLATWGTGGTFPLVQYLVTGLTPGLTYTITVYAYVPTGSPGVTSIVAIYGPWGSSTGSTKDSWVRLTWTGTAPVASLGFQIWPNSSPTAGQTVYLDGLQVEEGASATVYCDGDQAGSEWDGTAHASTSRRLPELAYSSVTLDYDDSTIANQVKITRVGGSEQTEEDTASQSLNLIHTHRRTDLLMQTDAVANDYAGFLLYQAKDPELRFSTLTLMPRADGDHLFPQALGRRFGDRVRIVKRPPGGGSISREVFIRGVEYDISPLDWRVTWVLQSATKWSFLILDHATLGTLDENALSY